MTLTSLAKKNKIFFTVFCLWLIACGLILLTTNKGDEILCAENNRQNYLDVFFTYWTHTGEGFVCISFSVLVSLYSFRHAIVSLIIFASSGLFVQFLKKIVYGPVPRPSKFFDEIQTIYGVEGVEMHSYFSFPSGHSVTAFALFTFIALLSNYKYGFIWLILAVLTALSRVYLCQHFLIDTFAGSVIGTVFCLVFWVWSSKWKWLQHSKLNGGFLNKKNK